jgi:peptidoglycan-associated lipoprotein
VEYNLALGERRARTAYDYLASLGVPADRMKTVSYGKEIPVCGESTEECWARNRRDHFAVTGKVSR